MIIYLGKVNLTTPIERNCTPYGMATSWMKENVKDYLW